MTINIDNIIKNIYATVMSHQLEEGVFARWIWQDENNSSVRQSITNSAVRFIILKF